MSNAVFSSSHNDVLDISALLDGRLVSLRSRRHDDVAVNYILCSHSQSYLHQLAVTCGGVMPAENHHCSTWKNAIKRC